ncbi:MAG TPA: aminoglycoside phosphotransferase family protein [Caulobacteraceae bacterium]|jgi:aminoglycoside phosphotransferase (APT) family kinase protein|nr:aminoglycoside phosphotransferase family protein [Caulobacteraceae bacterium]
MANDYDRHLAALHGRFEISDALIAEAARGVTPSPIAARTRIVHGEANEVYALAFESGLEVIVRIARQVEGVFDKERWALERCLALGMAVPRVLSIQRLADGRQALEVCILEKLAGQRLSDSLDLPPRSLRAVVRQVGAQLSLMHSITEADLGDGGRFFEGDTDDFLATEGEFTELAGRAGLDGGALGRAFRFVEATLATPLPRTLTHNDIRACHVMVHEGRLSGLIDFGQVSIDSPINEFGKWDYWEAPQLPAAWLMEGYGDKTLFAEGYAARFAAFRIANALWALRWYALTGYTAGVERARDRLVQYFAELG